MEPLEWDKRFLDLAAHISGWSKDPSTKVGCVITDYSRRIIGVGYNGFPRGIMDTEERLNNREIKYKLVVHAEVNAILNANSSVQDATIYTYPLSPCIECMKFIIQSGIKRVVYPKASPELISRWGESLSFAESMAHEASLVLVEVS